MQTRAKEKNLLQNGGAEKGIRYWSGFKMTNSDFYSGKYCFTAPLEKKKMIIGTYWYLIKVNPEKLYTFSANLKSTGQVPCKVTISMVIYDKFMRGYSFNAIYPQKGTDTQLTANAKAGDKVIRVKNAAKWLVHKHFAVAFHTKNAYADLPNHNLSRVGIQSLKKQEKDWDVELKYPLKKSYPTGTRVRLHRLGSDNLLGLYSQTIPNKWENYSFQFKGIRKLFEHPLKTPVKKFWYGTAYVGIRIVVKGTPGKSELLLDDISLTEK
jgi:hypothetical protein